MIIATPIDPEGRSAHSWGKAQWIGVADVRDGSVADWTVHEVRWDESHDAGTHGSHHARVVRFLKEQQIEAVVVDHVGDGMARMLHTMGIPILKSSPGDAQASVLAASRGPQL